MKISLGIIYATEALSVHTDVDLARFGPMLSPRVSHHVRLLVALVRLAVRSHRSKDLEIIVLRHQLTEAAPAGQPPQIRWRRPELARSDRGRAPTAEPGGWSPPTRCCAGTGDASPDAGGVPPGGRTLPQRALLMSENGRMGASPPNKSSTQCAGSSPAPAPEPSLRSVIRTVSPTPHASLPTLGRCGTAPFSQTAARWCGQPISGRGRRAARRFVVIVGDGELLPG